MLFTHLSHKRIDLDDTSCHSFKVILQENYFIVKSASISEKSSVQLLEAKDVFSGIGEKAIETQLALTRIDLPL